MTYYPIGIPTLCRYEHFKRCIESLKRNTHADKTELVVGLDYPPSEKYFEGYKKIEKYLNCISGFAKLTIIKHDHNLGSRENWKYIQNYIFENYDSAIMTEDDNEFSPCFLDYMNKALDIYKDHQNVLFICGYSSFLYDSGNGIYSAKAMSAWGMGTWKSKSEIINKFNTFDNLNSIIKDTRTSLKLFLKRPNSVNSIINQLKQKQLYEDACNVINCLLNNYYCIFPDISLVRNWGNDGSGEHCKIDNSFTAQKITEDEYYEVQNIQIKEDKAVRQLLRSSYNKPLHIKIVILVRYLIFRYLNLDIL